MSLNNNNTVKKRKAEQNALQDEKEGSAVAEVEEFQNTIVFLEEKLKSEEKKNDDLKQQIECPVCLQVPRKGPVYSCPNGHLVCQECKKDSCPMCRAAMGDNTSLLAIAVIERIRHDCKYLNFGCEEKFPFDEIEEHEEGCKHRVVPCPYFLRCSEMVPFSKLLTHLETSPLCCFTRKPLVFYGSSRAAGFSVVPAIVSSPELAVKVKTFTGRSQWSDLSEKVI